MSLDDWKLKADSEGSDWKLKVKVKCEECHGIGWWEWESTPSGSPSVLASDRCTSCEGRGYFIKEVHPEGVEEFLGRKESIEFACICGKKERILRPKEGQIPGGWVCWDSNYLCNDCKYKVMFAALQGAAMKIQQIKEGGSESYKRQDDSFHC